jgi:hypothetical protein
MKIKYILAFFLGAVLVSCGAKKQPIKKDPYEKLKSLNWLIGSWENKSPEGTMTESWSVLNDSVYVGTSSYVEGGVTLFSEEIRLEQKGVDIFYIPTIKDTSGVATQEPTQFKLTMAEGQKAKFENAKHDFPQLISYELKGDSMLAEISGKMEGKDHSEKFPMVKAK